MTLDARTIALAMGGQVNRKGDAALVPGPKHSAKDRSLSVKPDPKAPEGFAVHSFAGDNFAECRDHVKDKLGVTQSRQSGRSIVATYDYVDEHDHPQFQVVRFEPKGFAQRRPDGHGGWVWNLDSVQRVPYRLPELIEAVSSGYFIVIVEGEKDADRLRGIGINATTCAGGAGKWRDEYNQHFAGANVIIVPDNDEPGRNHAREVAAALKGIAGSIRVLDIGRAWPQCPPKGDTGDWLASGGTREQIDRLIEEAPNADDWGTPRPSKSAPASEPTIQTAADLRLKTFAPLKYIVPGLIVEGLVILAGKPKVKKSWLALDIALAVGTGRICLGDRRPQQGSVLYLGLEDGERRLQRRIDKILSPIGTEWPAQLNYQTRWPRADQGGIQAIDEWCASKPDARLVVIDVLARFRVPSNGRANAYAEDYAALSKLQELAVKHSVAILVVHHTRKGESEDPAEEISGTLGLSGCADAFMVLKKGATGATLIGRGRDIEDIDLAVQFNDDSCRWTILGEAAEVHRSDQRAAVLAALANATDGLSTTEITAAAALVSRTAADKLLLRMADDGQIKRLKRGFYSLPISQSPTPWEKREKGRLEPKSLKEQTDNGQSPNLPHLPPVVGGGRKSADDDYPDMPESLRRSR